MSKYHLFISRQARHEDDAGGLLIALRAREIEEARAEAEEHVRSDEDVADTEAEILEIASREILSIDAIFARREAAKRAAEKARHEVREREELARLRAKYDGGES